ncbi:aminoacyl-tRNA deacylase [Fontibacillus sp. BL9]|uniref:aminoacyl-tRNA deacylase n=1 Tax=Fontibacillus sp. BL9 TaxID=3389971 RepID=UPI00397D8E5D
MEKLVHFLQENQAKYEIISHERPIASAQDGADLFGIELGQTAPALIVKGDDGYAALIISGDYGRVDFAEVAQKAGLEKLKLAKPREVVEATGFSIGSVPLIGHGLPVILDSKLFRYEWIFGGTGVPEVTLKINPSEVERLNRVIARL